MICQELNCIFLSLKQQSDWFVLSLHRSQSCMSIVWVIKVCYDVSRVKLHIYKS